MKPTPIYILLLIFFLNFDLAWGMGPNVYEYDKFQGLYSINNFDNGLLQLFELVYEIGDNTKFESRRINQRLRLNNGLNKVYFALDYDLGYNIRLNNDLYAMPYFTLGSNVYSILLGAGIDVKYLTYKIKPKHSRDDSNSWSVVANVNYKFNKELFGHTDASQWYLHGISFKIGVEYEFRSFLHVFYCDPD